MEIMSFTNPQELRAWLVTNCHRSEGICLQIYKKKSGAISVTYAEALDQALCFGWIDGQKKPFDQQSWIQHFTPRRSKSGWSKINTEHAERLIESGEMTPAGLKEIDAAKADGRWAAAYDSFASATIPEDFLKKLAQSKLAFSFFKTLNKTNLYSIAYRLQTAKKPETREKRIQAIIEKLSREEKFH
ncbi:MAG: YdeI/OmpD-associated family protein [Verrucomicrobia bacterium]|nr:YdeI/OmpD-associated family protein [Verrucomicrobiota bacterium]